MAEELPREFIKLFKKRLKKKVENKRETAELFILIFLECMRV